MSTRFIRRARLLIGIAVVLCGAVAGVSCANGGSAANPAPLGGAGTGGTTSYAGTGGLPLGGSAPVGGCVNSGEIRCSSGGTPGSGGTSQAGSTSGTVDACVRSADGATDIDFPGSTVKLCACASAINLPLDSFKPCTMKGCHSAHCVPKNVTPPGTPVDLLGTCENDTTLCVPDDYIKTYDKFQPKKCISEEGAEGRCISTCIPQVNGLMDALPKADCGENERCAPCFNPNDGTDTHACSQGCDEGPSQATKDHIITFDKCGNDLGRCIPKSLVPPVLLTELPQDSCTKADYICAPLAKAQNLKYNFPQCATSDGFVSLLQALAAAGGPGVGKLPTSGQIGGCVPAYIITANVIEALFLTQDTCKAGEICAPCDNPLRGNTPTGACPVPLPSDDAGGLPPAPPEMGSGGGGASSGGASNGGASTGGASNGGASTGGVSTPGASTGGSTP